MHTRLHSFQAVRTPQQAGKPAAMLPAWRLMPWLLLSLCGAVPVVAQDAAPRSSAQLLPVPAIDQEAPGVTAVAAASPDNSPLAPATAAAPELRTVSAQQGSLPSGVCPVISGYLLDQCQQNPADPMCSFVPGA